MTASLEGAVAERPKRRKDPPRVKVGRVTVFIEPRRWAKDGSRAPWSSGSPQKIAYPGSGCITRLHFGSDSERSRRAAMGRKRRDERRTPVW